MFQFRSLIDIQSLNRYWLVLINNIFCDGLPKTAQFAKLIHHFRNFCSTLAKFFDYCKFRNRVQSCKYLQHLLTILFFKERDQKFLTTSSCIISWGQIKVLTTNLWHCTASKYSLQHSNGTSYNDFIWHIFQLIGSLTSNKCNKNRWLVQIPEEEKLSAICCCTSNMAEKICVGIPENSIKTENHLQWTKQCRLLKKVGINK